MDVPISWALPARCLRLLIVCVVLFFQVTAAQDATVDIGSDETDDGVYLGVWVTLVLLLLCIVWVTIGVVVWWKCASRKEEEEMLEVEETGDIVFMRASFLAWLVLLVWLCG